MLLEKILNQAPDSATLLLRRSLSDAEEQPQLVRDVLALANAVGDEKRYLVFGAERGAGGVQIGGLDDQCLARFRALSEELGELIEPRIAIAQLFADIDGKTVAALEISGCTNPPYTLRQRIAENMRTGACWVRDHEDVRPARREDLDRIYAQRATTPLAPVQLGLDADPDCLQLALEVPDNSRPPSLCAREKLMSAVNAKKTAQRLAGTENTNMARLAHARIFGADEPFKPRGVDTLIEQCDGTEVEYRDADLHYFFEQQAVRLDFSMRNQLRAVLEDPKVEFNLPRVPGFEISDRLYADPHGQMTAVESSLAGYPEVEQHDDYVLVRARPGSVAPDAVVPVLETPLRIRVDPGMRGMKVAVRYRVAAAGLSEPVCGRLKLVFRT